MRDGNGKNNNLIPDRQLSEESVIQRVVEHTAFDSKEDVRDSVERVQQHGATLREAPSIHDRYAEGVATGTGLYSVSGIGPTRGSILEEAGVTTVSELVEKSVKDISSILDIATSSAKRLRSSAQEALNIIPVELDRDLIADEIRKNAAELTDIGEFQHLQEFIDCVEQMTAHADSLAEAAASDWASRARTLLYDAADEGNLIYDLECGWMSVDDAFTSESLNAVSLVSERHNLLSIHYQVCQDIIADALKTAVEIQSPQNRDAEMEYLGMLDFSSESGVVRAIELRQNSTLQEWEIVQVQALREQGKQPPRIAEILEREVGDIEQDISRAEESLISARWTAENCTNT